MVRTMVRQQRARNFKLLNHICGALLSVLFAGNAFAETSALSLSLPLACEPGKTCWIANYVDHDPGKGRRDFMCGTATHNGNPKMGCAIKE